MPPAVEADQRLEVAPETAEAYVRLGGSLAPGILLVCDHAENAVPEPYGSLGLPKSQLERHIGYDIGAKGLTVRLAAALGVPAVMTRFSRLLIDCNRGEDDPTLIMRLSDGAIIPGNRILSADERRHRTERFYNPYHAAITTLIDRALAAGSIPTLLSVHSFTPTWRDIARPWHAAVLWDKDPRLAVPLMGALRTDPALVVGDNEPYDGSLIGDCMWRHGTRRGLPHAIVEIRQDLIATESGQQAWADRLAVAMTSLLANSVVGPDLRVVRDFGSRAD